MPRGLIEVTDINISEDGSMFPDSGREFIRRLRWSVSVAVECATG